jgi:hypothetical protein
MSGIGERSFLVEEEEGRREEGLTEEIENGSLRDFFLRVPTLLGAYISSICDAFSSQACVPTEKCLTDCAPT